VMFTPTAIGSRTANLTFSDSAGNSPQAVSLSGTGTGPQASLTPTSLNFGNQTLGSSSGAQMVTLSNTGNAVLSITNVALSGSNVADFAISANACGSSLAAGASCSVAVMFTPTAIGSRTANLTLSGTGTGPQASLTPTSLNFGNQTLGSSSGAQMVTLSNTGNAVLSITNVALSGINVADFAISANACGSSLAAGASCSVAVMFTPTAIG